MDRNVPSFPVSQQKHPIYHPPPKAYMVGYKKVTIFSNMPILNINETTRSIL
uniref:Uncharacterized protein n=1 Tax=Rhizophora mucronata TaxID=61149 RepID=A0A2P2IVK3_RHIMU